MEPEISRRCSDCGASVRGNASFCPQCGKTLKAQSADIGPVPEAPRDMPARRMTDPARNASTIDPALETSPAAPITPAQEISVAGNNAAGDNRLRTDAVDSRSAGVDDAAARSKRQRVRTAARDVVEEKLSPRVERLRHASNIMLEEAAYDPSLRFVLVAVAILLLSLLLLLLNYLIG
jgi:hypothetical protein